MSYSSQKKRHRRQTRMLFAGALFHGLIVVLMVIPGLLLSNIKFIDNYLFQYYILLLLFFVYSIFLRRWGYCLIFCTYMLIHFTYISSVSNVFFDHRIEDSRDLSILYSLGDISISDFDHINFITHGQIHLSQDILSPFIVFDSADKRYTLVGINFADASQSQINGIYHNLEKFISLQDSTVILLGNFGMPIWSNTLRRFLQNTGLKVKNAYMLADQDHVFNFFAIPKFYIMSFDNVGINDIESDVINNKTILSINLGLH